MLNLEIYEEAMCCSTGICGPEPDQKLIRVNEGIEYLKKNQIEVHRFNLGNNPNEFLKNKTAISLIQQQGNDVLPITFIDGDIIKTGEYLTTDEIEEVITLSQMRNGGCCDGDGCC